MALNVEVGSVTQPGSTGNFDVNLAASFDPKALIMWATPVTADGIVAHASFSQGFATYRGSVVQQRMLTAFAEDNIGTSDTYRSYNNDGLIKLLDASGVVDLEIDFVSFTTGAGSKFTINFVNLHTTASIKINYMVFGGSDVEDALVDDFTQTAATGNQDETVVAGFGQPSFIMFHSNTVDSYGTPSADAELDIGWGLKAGAGNGRSVYWASNDAATTEDTGQGIWNNAALIRDAAPGGSAESTFTVAASSGFPTDGFRINKTVAGFSAVISYLAIKFSANVTITDGEGTARTTTGTTTLSGAASTTAKGMMLMNVRTTTANTFDTTSADAAFMGMGAVDSAGHERWAGLWDDDGQATASVASSAYSDTKSIRYYTPSSDALSSEADASLSGANAVLDYNDADASAFLYEWVIFAEAAGDKTINVSDTATITESVTRQLVSFISVSDTATIIESGTRTLVNNISVTDSSTITESQTLLETSFINVSDTGTITESTTRLIPELFISVTDSATITESVTLLETSFINVSDTATITESTTRLITSFISVTDSSSITEATTVLEVSLINVSDTATITETQSLLIPTLLVSATDTASITESQNLLEISFISVSDTATITESKTVTITASTDLTISVTDTSTITESVTGLLTSFISVSDTATITESTTRLLVSFISVSDTATITEATTRLVTSFINVTDSPVITESITLLETSFISVSDTASITEATTQAIVAAGTTTVSVADTATISESVSLLVYPDLQVFPVVGSGYTQQPKVEQSIIKVYRHGRWGSANIKVWNGTSWQTRQIKVEKP